MGNIVGNFMKPKEDIPTPEIKELSAEQVEIIKNTWKIVAASPFEYGETILYNFFEKYPHNQEKFASFKNTPLLLLKGTPGFRSHASRIINVFSCAIDGLDRENGLKEVSKILANVGKTHAQRKISKQSMMELRDVLTEALIAVCKLNEEGIVAWNIVLDIVWHVMFEVFDGRANQYL